jgi:hypothetical protein
MAIDHLRVVLAVARGVHGELEVLEAVVLGEEGHEGGQRVGRRRRVGEDLAEGGLAAVRAGDVLGDGHGQRRGVQLAEGHLDVVVVELGERAGRRGRGGLRSYGQYGGAWFPCNHHAPPELLVDPAGRLPALLVESLAGAELRQRDGGGTRFSEPGGDNVDGVIALLAAASAADGRGLSMRASSGAVVQASGRRHNVARLYSVRQGGQRGLGRRAVTW